jgi:Zn-dependent protease with chaperone function
MDTLMRDVWIAEIARISALAGVVPPPLRIISNKKNYAGGGTKGITISRDLLGAPSDVRLYLVAHELGHVVRRHQSIMQRWACLMTIPLCCVFSTLLLHASKGKQTLAIAFFLGSFYLIYRLYDRNELDADRFAAKYIGADACIAGSTEMGRISGTLHTGERRAKLAALLLLQQKKCRQ